MTRLETLAGLLTAVFALGSLTPSRLLAQATSGEIVGIVRDASGDPVPGALVTALNEDTGLSRSAVSGDGGAIRHRAAAAGPLRRHDRTARLQDRCPRARRTERGRRGCTLDVALEVGDVSEVVNVTSETPLVETTRSDLAGVVTPREIAEPAAAQPHLRRSLDHHARGPSGR